MECVHERLARAERDRRLVEDELVALRSAGVHDPDEEWALMDLLAAIERRAAELSRIVAA
jgi:hypothetical protein